MTGLTEPPEGVIDGRGSFPYCDDPHPTSREQGNIGPDFFSPIIILDPRLQLRHAIRGIDNDPFGPGTGITWTSVSATLSNTSS